MIINIVYRYVPEIQPDNTFGSRLANGSFSGMIGATYYNVSFISYILYLKGPTILHKLFL